MLVSSTILTDQYQLKEKCKNVRLGYENAVQFWGDPGDLGGPAENLFHISSLRQVFQVRPVFATKFDIYEIPSIHGNHRIKIFCPAMASC